MLAFAYGFKIAIWLAGLALFARILLGRLRLTPPALAAWPVSIEGFVTAIMLVAAGGFLMPQAAAYLSDDVLGPAARDGNWWMVVQGFAFQSGLLGGVFLSFLHIRRQLRQTPPPLEIPVTTPAQSAATPTRHPLLAGTVTFLVAVPLIDGLGFGWKILLEQLGYSTGEQEMIDLFRSVDHPLLLVLIVTLAAVVAPITEELIFRAGLFRYLRTRIPRPLALVIPALLFALPHGNLAAFLPLCILGVIFSLAYERTGRIAVPMIAHALFNLHTLLLVMSGVTS